MGISVINQGCRERPLIHWLLIADALPLPIGTIKLITLKLH